MKHNYTGLSYDPLSFQRLLQSQSLRGFYSKSKRFQREKENQERPERAKKIRPDVKIASPAVQVQLLEQDINISEKTEQKYRSVALWGNALKEACLRELSENNEERIKSKKYEKKSLKYQKSKISCRGIGSVEAYAANTTTGNYRNYNQDRVSIILNVIKPQNRASQFWPSCSFFGVYDGHGGAGCSDFLRDKLHQYVIKQACFPRDPKEAIRKGFKQCQQDFLAQCQSSGSDKSGSCANVVLIVGRQCFTANVGDSRCVMSACKGRQIFNLSNDHKPTDSKQQQRIVQNGGKIFYTKGEVFDIETNELKEQRSGPLRVLPGRLSVTRTFGDINAKLQKYGGNPNVVIACPQISYFELNSDHDFLLIGCDGVFDRLTSAEAVETAWRGINSPNPHINAGNAVDHIMQESLLRESSDNVTVVCVMFSRRVQQRRCNSLEKEKLQTRRRRLNHSTQRLNYR